MDAQSSAGSSAAFVVTSSLAVAQPPVQSFAELQRTFTFGQRIIVTAEDGRTTEGRLVSISGNQLEIRRTRWFFREERKAFVEESVQRIENRDSTWNGTLIGLGVGFLISVVADRTCDEPDFGCAPQVLLPVPVGSVVGALIDRNINRPIFLSPRGRRVTMSPLVGPGRVGLAAAVRF